MFSIKLTYKGKQYDDFAQAFNAATSDKLTEWVQNKLAPFKDELIKAGATVRIVLDENYKGNIIIENVPEELKERVETAIRS